MRQLVSTDKLAAWPHTGLARSLTTRAGRFPLRSSENKPRLAGRPLAKLRSVLFTSSKHVSAQPVEYSRYYWIRVMSTRGHMTHPLRHYQADMCHVTQLSNYETVTVCWCQHGLFHSIVSCVGAGDIRSERFASKKAIRSNS